MKLQDQVITLEQAKRLKELGVNAPSLFAWCSIMPDPIGDAFYIDVLYTGGPEQTLTEFIAPAYTVAELGVMLPAFPNCNWETYYHSGDDTWNIQLNGVVKGDHKSEAQARAALLIYLLENNLITADQVNKAIIK